MHGYYLGVFPHSVQWVNFAFSRMNDLAKHMRRVFWIPSEEWSLLSWSYVHWTSPHDSGYWNWRCFHASDSFHRSGFLEPAISAGHGRSLYRGYSAAGSYGGLHLGSFVNSRISSRNLRLSHHVHLLNPKILWTWTTYPLLPMNVCLERS